MYIEIGYAKDAVIDDKEIKKQLDLTLEGLKKIGIIDDDMKLVDYAPIVMDPAYVHISTKTDEKISRLKEDLANEHIYTIGRYGAWIYNSMEDSMLVAKDLAEKIN